MSFRASVERQWESEAGSGVFGAVLGALATGFRAAVGARTALYDRGLIPSERGPIPVISVGNVTVGGTGKTPVVRWIVDLLREAGRRPAVVLRGYGDDELHLHRRWYADVPVLTAARRIEAVREAAKQGADVAVCDDAFQHRSLIRDLDIVLLSADDDRPFRMLPAGPYRESLTAVRRSDLILITQKVTRSYRSDDVLRRLDLSAIDTPAYGVTLTATGWSGLDGAPKPPPVGDVLVVSGVGAPRTVETVVRGALPGVQVEEMSFPDHHTYTTRGVERILRQARGRPIVTTEKDAVKLHLYKRIDDQTWVIPIGVTSVEDESTVRARLLEACAP